MTTGRMGVGIIGTGNISSAYLRAITGHENMAGFPVLDIKGLADMRPEASQARAAEFSLDRVGAAERVLDTLPEIHVHQRRGRRADLPKR